MKEKELERLLNLKKEEKALYEKGIVSICGIDEAGRGPLAGPVVVACSLMPKDSMIEGVNDSKKIAEKKRERIYEEIRETEFIQEEKNGLQECRCRYRGGIQVGRINEEACDRDHETGGSGRSWRLCRCF